VDPLVDVTGTPYAFTDGDPVNGTDPLGLCWPSWACGVEHFVSRNASTIAFVSGIAAQFIPGVDVVVDLGAIVDVSVSGALSLTANSVSISTGALASDQDFSHGNYLSGTLDLVGSVGGLGALHLNGVANLEELAAGRAWRSSEVQSWILRDARDYARYASWLQVGAFGLGSVPNIASFFSGGSAWAEGLCH